MSHLERGQVTVQTGPAEPAYVRLAADSNERMGVLERA